MEKLTMTAPQKKNVKDLNDFLTCKLCNGYLIDATTLTECHHVFCRGCILRHFENSTKTVCPHPHCNTSYKKKTQAFFKPDTQLQALIYKLVPGLYSKEMQRRDDFYRSTGGARASSSCSDDSVIERERGLHEPEDSLTLAQLAQADRMHFFGPEDTVSLSLEYYQSHLDSTEAGNNNNNNNNNKVREVGEKEEKSGESGGERRFLQCPAAVTMQHLQKFVRMKYALTVNHRVDIIYKGEVLPGNFSLMDVAYSFKWKRLKPLRFFYRIFTPMKVQPIKIINTTLSTGCKQLQVVKNEKPSPSPSPLLPPPPPPPLVPSSTPHKLDQTTKLLPPPPEKTKTNKPTLRVVLPPVVPPTPTRFDDDKEKERLLANLHLKKNKGESTKSTSSAQCGTTIPDCVFDYEEPDKEEIKRFAEIRDREWAMQKRQEESRHNDEEYYRFNRKRKKNKHSKNGSESLHKKRKLHAEITNKDEEELKLKVKLTQPNGHKHKHHKTSSSTSTNTTSVPHPPPSSPSLLIQPEVLNNAKKEKLLQMRQIRHKQVIGTTSSTETVKTTSEPVKKVTIVEPAASAAVPVTAKSEVKAQVPPVLPVQSQPRVVFQPQSILKNNSLGESGAGGKKITSGRVVVPNVSSPLERKIANLQQRCTIEATTSSPTLGKKVPASTASSPFQQYPPGFTVSKIENGTSSGTKRKLEEETNGHQSEKRPSLEITLINPGNTESGTAGGAASAKPKRPPPATIPLERIKRSYAFNNKSGISIIAKSGTNTNQISSAVPPPLPTECDNIGALDLSSKKELATNNNKNNNINNNGFSTSSSSAPGSTATPPNGKVIKESTNAAKNILSNLQMLSKVATEHQNLASTTSTASTAGAGAAKPRPQIPNLQTLKIPSLAPARARNLDNLPKLTEINKTFRMQNPQIRNLRPTSSQNQSIRNIPNPSLLVRQQNQNRLNSLMGSGSGVSKSNASVATVAVTSSAAAVTAAGACEPAKAAVSESNKNKN